MNTRRGPSPHRPATARTARHVNDHQRPETPR